MGLRINLNTAAVSSHRTLQRSDGALSKSIERLSSGFRVNSAGDDPAGLVISEKLRAQVGGLGQAIKNAGDAVNMVKTAEGALGEVHRVLRSMRDLAVHAANSGATDSAAAQADQALIDNAVNSLNKIASETQFGNRKLLDGSAGIKTFINGTKVMAGDLSFATGLVNGADIKVGIATAASQAIINSSATYGTAASAKSLVAYTATTSVFDAAGGTMTIAAGGRGVLALTIAAGSTVDSIKTAINLTTSTTGLTATLEATTNKLVITGGSYGASTTVNVAYSGGATIMASATTTGTNGTFATSAGSMYVNGTRIDYSSGDSSDIFISKINAQTSLTGIAAAYDDTTNKIKLNSQSYGAKAIVNVTSGTMFLGSSTSATNTIGVNATAVVTKTIDGATTNLSDETWTYGDGLTIKDKLGNIIILTTTGGTSTSDTSSQFTSEVNTLKFQVGAYADQTRDVNINAVFAGNLGNGIVADKNMANINLTTPQGAQDAIEVIDKAISDISNIRASLGATQINVLESSINSLSIAKENLSASESSIRDTDMAAEMVEFTKLQILNQAGIAMLAQANQAPQQLMSLLQ